MKLEMLYFDTKEDGLSQLETKVSLTLTYDLTRRGWPFISVEKDEIMNLSF